MIDIKNLEEIFLADGTLYTGELKDGKPHGYGSGIVDEIKELCEEMYIDGEISRTGNYRYFILTEEKEKPKPKKTSAPKSEAVDVKAELKKYKEMLDEGLIDKEDYEAKKDKLLGI